MHHCPTETVFIIFKDRVALTGLELASAHSGLCLLCRWTLRLKAQETIPNLPKTLTVVKLLIVEQQDFLDESIYITLLFLQENKLYNLKIKSKCKQFIKIFQPAAYRSCSRVKLVSSQYVVVHIPNCTHREDELDLRNSRPHRV